MLDRLFRRLRNPFEHDPEAEVRDEIEFHLEQRIRDNLARGMDPAAARAAALARFGNLNTVRQECTRMLEQDRKTVARRDWFADLRQDLSFGLRSALRSPLFTLLAVVTLALGIGANAAVFGVVKSVLLDALPYRDVNRLVRVYGRLLDGSVERGAVSAGTVHDIGERQRSFTELAAFQSHTLEAVYGGDEGPVLTMVGWVQPGLFRTLGVSPVIGRAFSDDDLSDTARVVLVSHGAWQRLLGGEPGMLGRDVRINGIARTVIGVLPRDFIGPVGDADFYFALDLGPTLRSTVSARRSHWLGMVGRLKPGVTQDAARRELAAIGADLAREYPADNGSIGVTAMPLRDAMVGDTRTPLLVLMASAGLVLLITCANLAGALLSRTISRRKEFAVRVALGAGRSRVVRQLLTESTFLAVVGGAAGIMLAVVGLKLLRGPAGTVLPAHADLTLDIGAVLVISLLALATGLGFGVAPALAVGRSDPQGGLREESRGASESRRSRSLRGALVAGQIALCISLLAGAGLLTRSLWLMTSTPLGFDPAGLLTASLQLPPGRYRNAEALARFHTQFADRLRTLPGVNAVGSATMLPTAVQSRMGFSIEGAAAPPADAQPFVLYAAVSGDYFRMLRIPLRQGRVFDDAQDHLDTPATVVISEGMARRYWPGGNALGARIRLGPDMRSPLLEVIGIVGDVRNDPARSDAEPMAYRSTMQAPWPIASFILRTQSDPRGLVKLVERELAALDPGLPISRSITLQDLLSDGLAGRRLPVLLMSAFGALALVLASVGVYAMFAAMAGAREREFGVRIALGSSRRAIATLVLRQGGGWMVLGLVGGVAGATVVARMVSGLLYGVSRFDPLSLGLTLTLLLGCAAVALMVPVRRATRVDPITAMR